MRRKKEVNEKKKETWNVFRQLGYVDGLSSNHGFRVSVHQCEALLPQNRVVSLSKMQVAVSTRWEYQGDSHAH